MHMFWDPAATRVLAAQKQIGLVSTEAWEHYHSKHSPICGFTGRPTLRHLYKTYRKSSDRMHFKKTMIQVEKFESLWGCFSNGHMRADAMAFLPLFTKHSSTRPYLPVGKSKSIKGNLPRLKLYRPISVRALGVRHSIHFGILLLHDTRCSRSGRPGSLFATGLRRSRRGPAG